MVEVDTPWWKNWDLSYTGDVFGPIYGGGSVQEAFSNTLQKWFPTYIAEVNRKLGAEILEAPKDYALRPDYRPLAKDPKVAILINVPHTVGNPETFSAGISAKWRVDVMIFIYGTKDWQETQALTYAYATCLRALVLQNRDLGGFANTTVWEGDEYLEGEHTSTRTTGVAHVTFVVTVSSVGSVHSGPPSAPYASAGSPVLPSVTPYPNNPMVTVAKPVVTQQPL